MSQFKDLITIELINSLGKLRSFNDRDEATRNPEMDWAEITAERIANLFNSQYVPFVSEVEEFNSLMNTSKTTLQRLQIHFVCHAYCSWPVDAYYVYF